MLCRLLSLSFSLSCTLLLPYSPALPPRSLTYLFLSPSLAPFLPRLLLLLHFCPFARFLLPQTTAAYLYPVFASRARPRERGCFCSLLPSWPVVVVVSSPSSSSLLLPLILATGFLLPSSSLNTGRIQFVLQHLKYIMSYVLSYSVMNSSIQFH